MTAHLTLIETSGNQAYIYATNRLRDNIGASELTWRAGLRWTLEAAGMADWLNAGAAGLRERLRQQPRGPDGVEVVVAASGKAIVLCDSPQRARALVAAVTERAAREAPGLLVTGASVPLADRGKVGDVAQAMHALHQQFNTARDAMAGAMQREALMPFVQPCATSGRAAAALERDGEAQSAMTRAKTAVAGDWFERVRPLLPQVEGRRLRIAHSADQLERDFAVPWAAVVYADGNGLGQILLSFERWLGHGADYLAALRGFSLALDAATEAAFGDACLALWTLLDRDEAGDRRLPVVPLVLGGDDLTVQIDGRLALPFTEAFLRAFERRSGEHEAIRAVAGPALGVPHLSCGAGVAIVKPHFPFHAAYELAEALLQSAKAVKRRVQRGSQPWPCSALDFHVLYDASGGDLHTIRARRQADDGSRLWGGPYVVTPLAELAGADPAGQDWARLHHLDGLLGRIRALAATADGRRRLPASQAHWLRDGLAAGCAASDAQLAALRRYEAAGLTALYEDGGDGAATLFARDVGSDQRFTRFLDALSAMDFWPDGAPGLDGTREAQP